MVAETNPSSEVSDLQAMKAALGLQDDPPEVQDEEEFEQEASDSQDDSEAEEEVSEPEEKYWEITHNGETKKLKDAEIKEYAQKGFDYTQKTQSLAEERKAIQAERERVAAYEKEMEALENDKAELKWIDFQLKNYENVDWNKLAEDDPIGFNKHSHFVRQLETAKARKEGTIKEVREKLKTEKQQEYAKRVRETLETLKRDIPDWNTDHQRKLDEYGRNFGFSTDELREMVDPRVIKMMDKAFRFDQLKSQKPTKELPKVAKPGAQQDSSKASKTRDAIKRLRESNGRDSNAATEAMKKFI